MDSVKLFKCLSDKSRIKLILALKEKPAYVELLAEKLQLSPSTVSFHLKKLQELSIVTSKKDQYYTVYSLNSEELNKTVFEFICASQAGTEKTDADPEEAYRQKVIKSFFHYETLKQIPVQMKKRQIVLSHIVRKFEFGREYPEKELDEILKAIFHDHCALRRAFIESGLMYRINNVYHRTETKPEKHK